MLTWVDVKVQGRENIMAHFVVRFFSGNIVK